MRTIKFTPLLQPYPFDLTSVVFSLKLQGSTIIGFVHNSKQAFYFEHKLAEWISVCYGFTFHN